MMLNASLFVWETDIPFLLALFRVSFRRGYRMEILSAVGIQSS